MSERACGHHSWCQVPSPTQILEVLQLSLCSQRGDAQRGSHTCDPPGSEERREQAQRLPRRSVMRGGAETLRGLEPHPHGRDASVLPMPTMSGVRNLPQNCSLRPEASLVSDRHSRCP